MIETYIVDSFTDKAFKGNPAGVCLLEKPISENLMLSIANELGLSETAFVLKIKESESYSIRYFSPVMEIPLCGHATLASSKVLFEKNPEKTEIQFINIQDIELDVELIDGFIKMIFPVYDVVPSNANKDLLDALGISEINNCAFNEETNLLMIEIKSSLILRELKPDFEALKRSHDSINGVLITAASEKKDIDFESRFFWPWSGTNEDPVTGGTHTFLSKYWSDRLGKKKMNSFQCSKRTGFMEIELLDEGKFSIKSQAQIIFEGKLRL